MGKKKSVVIGYRYFMGLDMSICYGPVDSFMAVIAGDRAAWTGNQTSSGQITISARELFGGDKKEGGLDGLMDVCMGEASQLQNDYLVSKIGSDVPAYRGITRVVYRGGEVSSMSPYVKPFAFQVKRILKGWYGDSPWYSAKAAIGDTMNPAHIVYECLTNPEWGMGYPAGSIDNASFQAVADTLYSEGFGLCLVWNRQETIRNFVQMVMGYINGVLRLDLTTGKFTIKLMRDDYTLGSLPVLNPNNVVSLDNYQRMSLAETINEVNVIYTDPTTGKETGITVHDNANIAAQRGIVSYTANYQGITSSTIATKVALRDLLLRATPLAKLKLTVNREGFMLQPGDAFRFTWPKLGVDAAFRILSLNYGTVKEGAITVDAVEDVFGLPSSTYAAQQPVGWSDPTHAAAQSPNRVMFEMPYFVLATNMSDADLSYLTSTSSYLMMLAQEPSSDALQYELWTAAGSASLVDRTSNPHTPVCQTTGTLSKTATSIACTTLPDQDRYSFTLGNFIVVDSEVMRLDAINYGTNTLTVARGCLDTVPATHSAGARVWFAEDFYGADNIEYATSDVVKAKVQTVTGLGALAIGSAPQDTLTMQARQYKPYPPGLVRFNGYELPSTIAGALTVTWAHRDRLSQTASIIDQNTGSIGPEDGVTYEIDAYNENGVLSRSVTGLTGTSWTWSTESVDSGLVVNADLSAFVAAVLADSPYSFHQLLDTGSSAADSSGNSRTGTYTNGAAGNQLQKGVYGALLDGSNDYVALPTGYDDFTNGISLFALWYPTRLSAYERIFDFGNGPGSNNIYFAHNNSGPGQIICGWYNGASPGPAINSGSNYVTLNRWNFVGVTVNSSKLAKLWINGTQVASATLSTLPNNISRAGNSLGKSSWGTDVYMQGNIACAAVFNTGISDARVAAYWSALSSQINNFRLNNQLRIKLRSRRSGVASWQEHDHTMTR